MNKTFEKILERLEEERELSYADFSRYVDEVSPCLDAEYDDFFHRGLERASRLVKEAAEEYNNGWIPCSERLPEDNGVYFVTLDDDIMPRCIDVRNFRNGVFEQRFIVSPLQGKCPEEKVVAWMPLPEPYKEND